jgi:hypothetical protein
MFLVALITTQSFTHFISSDRNAELLSYFLILDGVAMYGAVGPLVSDARKTTATTIPVTTASISRIHACMQLGLLPPLTSFG